MRSLLLWLLKLLFRSEKPTDNELIAYGAEQERNRQIVQATVYAPVCEIHAHHKLEHVGYGFYRCGLCQSHEGPFTDPMQQLPPLNTPPERPLLDYLHKQHKDIGPETERHRSVQIGRGKL